MGESRNAYRVLVGRPEGKRSLGRPRRRWEDNIEMDLREVRYDDRDWIDLAQDRDLWLAYVRAHRKLPSICSYWVEGKPRKNLNQVTCPDRDSNPGHLVSQPDALTVTPQFLRAGGSWLESCNYYAHHLQSVKKVVQSFDPDDAAATQIRQELLNDRKIEKEVMDIKPNFGYLPDAIIQLEKSRVELVEQINIMRIIVNKLSAVEGEIGKRVGEKMNRVLIKNDGYGILSRISDVLTRTCPNDVIQHYSPIVSADVERSFSMLKISFLATEQSCILKI
ncbi:hypothetical protein ANN_10021 [Periplaneta americana]|uniref:Uncharacterized protein n=1 Tax=Periplaneta americana TaxID=6978 RepID=A0ABQ8TPF1_PERAM|nr:hypothetical protein ANN_10021 [Periplaneta americana]